MRDQVTWVLAAGPKKPVLRKREFCAFLKISNQALSVDYWSHWTWLHPFERYSPRESMMPLKCCQNSTGRIPGLDFLSDLLISDIICICISIWRNAHLRRRPKQAMERSFSGDAFSLISPVKTPWDLLSRCCFWHSFDARVQTIEFVYISGGTWFRAVSRQALQIPASADLLRPVGSSKIPLPWSNNSPELDFVPVLLCWSTEWAIS